MMLAEYGRLVVELSEVDPPEAERIAHRVRELDALIDCMVAAAGISSL